MSVLAAPAADRQIMPVEQPAPPQAPRLQPFSRRVIDWARTEFNGVAAEHFYVHHLKDVDDAPDDPLWRKGRLVGWERIADPAAVEALLDAYDAGTLETPITDAARTEILSLLARRA